jgi:hypothetical protein
MTMTLDALTRASEEIAADLTRGDLHPDVTRYFVEAVEEAIAKSADPMQRRQLAALLDPLIDDEAERWDNEP